MDSKLLITFEAFPKLVLEDREDPSLTCKVMCHTYGLGMHSLCGVLGLQSGC